MSDLSVIGYMGRNNVEFKRHYNAVKFCIENQLSFPIETSAFFKGKLGGDDLESIRRDAVLRYIENGIEMKIPLTRKDNEVVINTADIPSEVEFIHIKLI